jgi:flagellar basal body-associated protein FliL
MNPLGLVLFALIILGSWYWWQRQPDDKRGSATLKLILIFVTIGLLAMAITGRMHWLGALIALVLPFLQKLLPLLLRFLPSLAGTLNRKRQQKKQQRSNRSNKQMSRDEALEILGLKPDANRDDVIQAHRRLIQKLHPDRDGSAYLAARINEARDRLLE